MLLEFDSASSLFFHLSSHFVHCNKHLDFLSGYFEAFGLFFLGGRVTVQVFRLLLWSELKIAFDVGRGLTWHLRSLIYIYLYVFVFFLVCTLMCVCSLGFCMCFVNIRRLVYVVFHCGQRVFGSCPAFFSGVYQSKLLA